MVESKGPWFEKTIDTPADIQQLRIANPEQDLKFVTDGITLIKRELNDTIPLIGFAGAPWTIFSYMIEGKGSKTFSKARTFLYQHPEASHQLLQMITDSTIVYLKAQVAAGVNLVQLFDSWAGILSPQQYNTFSMPYIRQICDAITEVPKTVFPKGAFFARAALADLSCDVIGLDWNMDIGESKALVGGKKALQGNLDPCVLFAGKETVQKATIEMLQAFGGNHIANLGHGVYPDTPLDNVKLFVDTVQNYRY